MAGDNRWKYAAWTNIGTGTTNWGRSQVTGNVTGDGFDIETGLFNVGIDGIFDNAGGGVSPVFGTAGVYLIPESSTALLVGA